MKGLYVSLLVIAVAVLAVSGEVLAADCPKICKYDYTPVCGYDGKCYHVYGNECTLKSHRCESKEKKDLKLVEMDLCDEALEDSNPKVPMCT